MQALCAEFRDANIYTRVNLQSDGVNYAFSLQSRSKLNTGSKMASIYLVSPNNYQIFFFFTNSQEMLFRTFVRFVTFAAFFTLRHITLLPNDRNGRDDFRSSSMPRKHQRRFTILAVLGVPRIDALVSAGNIGLSRTEKRLFSVCNQPPDRTRRLTSQLGRILAGDRELLWILPRN